MDHNTADEIRRRFEALDSKGALIDLINYARKSFYPKRDGKIPLRSLTYYADHRKCLKRYNEFIIKKKNGGERVINTPVKGLKEIQRALNAILSCIYIPHQAAYGFVPKRSIVDAAREHAGMKYVFCTDLKDFFPSIGLYRVKSCLMMPPFSLNNEEREPLAYFIANLCCDVKEIRRYLHFWEILGKEKAEEIFIEDFGKDKPHWIDNRPGNRKDIPSLENYLNGKLLFLKMVKGDKNEQYLKLRGRFLSLSIPELSEQMRALSEIEFQLNSLLKEESLNEKEAKKITKEFKEIWQNINKEKIYSTPQLKQIKRIEEKLLKLRVQTDDPAAYREEGKRHDPERLVDLLFKHFSGKDGALKFSVHEWDKGRHEKYFLNHEEFTREIDGQWNEIKDDFFKFNENLAALFYWFLIVKNKDGKVLSQEEKQYEWGSEHVSIGWRSTELEEWCEKNPDEQPSSFKLPASFKTTTGKECTTFRDIIELFQGEFQFREDINSLTDFFKKEVRVLTNSGVEVCRKDVENEQLYTHVQAIRNTVARVFDRITRCKTPQSVKISTLPETILIGDQKREVFDITILHVDSNTSKNSKQLWEAKYSGDFKRIRKQLWNVCDWSVETQCQDGCFRFNYLTSYTGMKDFEEIENPGGFKHVFRFYLPKQDEY